jgi:ribose transport system permease protein
MESTSGLKRKILVFSILVLGILALMIVFNIIVDGRFLTLTNINALLTTMIVTSFLAWGYCFIFALNYMDLSVGAAYCLCIYGAGELGNRLGIPGVLLGGIIVGIILMSINFNVFAWSKIPSWIAGLGMCLVYEAVAALYTAYQQDHGGVVVLLAKEYTYLGRAPGIYIIFILGILLAYLVYNRTPVGLNVRAIGSNPSVAKAMGINIPVTLILTGIVCGVFVGCAGLLQESIAQRIFAMTGITSLSAIFHPLATVLLAQVLSKWINIIIAVPFCALFVYICFNAFTILGIPSGTLQDTALGFAIVVFGIFAQRSMKGVVK